MAIIVKPISFNFFAIGIIAFLSPSFTDIKTLPFFGRLFPALIDALKKDSPIVFDMPITSPVDFISGLKKIDSSGNLLNGRTASFTAMCL